jgi:hypothetical protein
MSFVRRFGPSPWQLKALRVIVSKFCNLSRVAQNLQCLVAKNFGAQADCSTNCVKAEPQIWRRVFGRTKEARCDSVSTAVTRYADQCSYGFYA